MPIDAMAMQIRIDHLTKYFDATTAVNGVSLTVPAGEFLTVTGPRGSGKSTLLRVIAGVEAPSRGTVSVGSGDPAKHATADRAVVLVSVEDLTAEFGVTRLAKAACVLCDDPLAQLDGPARAVRRDALKAAHARLGTTFVCATEDPDDALALSNRVALLCQGRLLQCATPAQILETPATEFVARYFGRPPINLVPAILEKDGQAVLLGNQTVSLAGRIAETFCRDVTVGIRPAHVRLQADGVGWRGRVESIASHAEDTLVEVQVEGIRLRALLGARQVLRAGDAVRVHIRPEHYLVFDDHGAYLAQV